VKNIQHLDGAKTVGRLIETVGHAFDQAGLFYGHGTDNPTDEAAALVFHVMELDHAGSADIYDREVSSKQRVKVQGLMQQRIESRVPLAYMLEEAWFAGLAFLVDERVLVPRSPIAELIADRFEPWIDSGRVQAILDVGTGCGCLAVACAVKFPAATLIATDISSEALEVAQLNIERHRLSDRVQLVETDLMDGVQGSFDVIISNPPYVPEKERDELPAEYMHEPALGLFSGTDGLDSARRILQDAPKLLSAKGILVLEVGAQWQALEQAFPALPFTWLEFEHGGEGVAVLNAADLR
jgi:ribosomal protein L3 glutamine methyltransferase